MNYLEPKSNEYTIYSKSGCQYCLKAKDLLNENKLTYTIINCDEYLLENKSTFLEYIKNISGKNISSFPIIFYNNLLVGGYKDLQENIKQKDFSLNEDF